MEEVWESVWEKCGGCGKGEGRCGGRHGDVGEGKRDVGGERSVGKVWESV